MCTGITLAAKVGATILGVAVLMGVLAGNARAAEAAASGVAASAPQEMSADQVARELANPNTPLARLTLKNQWTHWDGDLPGANGSDSGTFQFQPGFPFPVGERKNVFFRPSLIYLVDQPVVNSSTGQFEKNPASRTLATIWPTATPRNPAGRRFGGIVGTFPTGADGLSSDTWTLGPEIAVAKLAKWGVWNFPQPFLGSERAAGIQHNDHPTDSGVFPWRWMDHGHCRHTEI